MLRKGEGRNVIRSLLLSLVSAIVSTVVVVVLVWVAGLVTPGSYQKWIKVVKVVLLLLIWLPLVIGVVTRLINQIPF